MIDLADRPAWVYELNPIGKVPVLERDGWVLPESAVINEYLEEVFPEPALLPADPTQRANARLLIFRHDDFTDPYYALRRKEVGAEVAFAGELEALDATLAADALSHRAGVRPRGHRLRPVGAQGARPSRCLARVVLRRSSTGLPACPERPSIQAELEVVAAL